MRNFWQWTLWRRMLSFGRWCGASFQAVIILWRGLLVYLAELWAGKVILYFGEFRVSNFDLSEDNWKCRFSELLVRRTLLAKTVRWVALLRSSFRNFNLPQSNSGQTIALYRLILCLREARWKIPLVEIFDLTHGVVAFRFILLICYFQFNSWST